MVVVRFRAKHHKLLLERIRRICAYLSDEPTLKVEASTLEMEDIVADDLDVVRGYRTIVKIVCSEGTYDHDTDVEYRRMRDQLLQIEQRYKIEQDDEDDGDI